MGKLLEKILGRREILAYIALLTYAWLSIAGKIDPKDVTSITILILGFYFVRRSATEGNRK